MGEVYTIHSNTVLGYVDDVRIGAGNFARDVYVDEKGVQQRGLTAALWMWTDNGSVAKQSSTVHVGQQLVLGEYQIQIVEINLGDMGPFVRLALSDQH